MAGSCRGEAAFNLRGLDEGAELKGSDRMLVASAFPKRVHIGRPKQAYYWLKLLLWLKKAREKANSRP